MNNAHLNLPPPEDLRHVQNEFLELHGSLAVMNTYLKLALLGVTTIALGLLFFSFKMYGASQKVKPLVIRISDIGRAEAINHFGYEYQPQEPEIKYFLTEFVHDYYGRLHATTKENFARSFYFLENRLAEDIMAKNKQTKALETFLSGQGEESDIEVKNVAIEDLRRPPYHATVDYDKVYYAPSTHQETHRERYVGNFVFAVKDNVPSALVPINPLGLTITYFREDEAFR